MARREIDDERRSYSAAFLLAVGLLLFGAVWSVWDDNIARRPWKYYQSEFAERERDSVRNQIKKEEERLQKDPAYQQLTKDLAAARERLDTGETAARIATLEEQLNRVKVTHGDADLKLRIVKSRLEEAWYEYDSAVLEKRSTQAARERIEALNTDKAGLEQTFNETKAELEKSTKELAEVRSEVKTLEDKSKGYGSELDRLEQKLASLTTNVGPLTLPPIPKIQQVVLEDFERNNFDKPVARVDRCESCHAGINKAGFEDAPNPYKTHPQREKILGKHPPEKFGCTPCHRGQGAAVNSPEQAHGEVRHWAEPLLRGAKVEASCIKCHANVENIGAPAITTGQNLFVELGCHGCHLAEGYEDIPKVGPYLRLVSAKLDPSWLVRWVTNPHQYRARTRMPNFLFKPEDAQAVAAYLLDSTKTDSAAWLESRPLPAGIDPTNAALVAQGKELIDTLGCRACHGFADGESPALLGQDKDIAPNLSRIAEKTNARWMYYWIKGPRNYSPVSRMPSLRLSDEEARAIVSFLLTLGEKQPPLPDIEATLGKPEEIARGKTLVRKYGCFGCHDIPGMENESRVGVELSTFGSKPLEELFFGNHTDIPETWDDWTYNKLKTPRTYATERIEQAMPQFDLSDADIKALRVFLASRTDIKYPEKFRAAADLRGQREVAGRRVVARYNCVGCHIIEGRGGAIRVRYQDMPTMAPPILNGEGAKVQSDWLFNFIKQPIPIRPWLKVRMPTFGLADAEVTTLVQYFGAVDDIRVPFVHIDDTQVPLPSIEAGQKLVSPDYFNCFSCHQQGDRKPEGPPEGWAPDLGMARTRLNPEWIVRWLHNPQAVQPGTKMPSFYEVGADGKASGGPDDVLGGDNEKQIQALRDYLMVLNHAQALLAKGESDGSQASAHDTVAAPGAN